MKKTLLITLLSLSSLGVYAQLAATFESTLNTNCLGQPCNYEGPTILINELMISPISGDGSIIDDAANLSTRRGEWIELYNPNLCEPVDISCYYLGNYVSVSPAGANGFRLPDNLIVPPGGFVLIRGINAQQVPAANLIQNGGNTIEITLPPFAWDDGVCSWGNRVWFPNVGGWFAFYDSNGEPQDAVSWANQGGIENAPCVAESSLCSAVASLPSYNDIPDERKAQATTTNASNHLGQSIRRIPDGGPWTGAGPPTIGGCNSLPCAIVGESTCTGTATVNVTGGTPPYNYLWNDSQLQMTQTAIGLCGEEYQVIVTDANGLVDTFTVAIENFVPTVTLDVAAEYCIYEDDVLLTNYSPVAGANESGLFTGNGMSGFTFSPEDAGAGTHDVTYTFVDENGCTNFATNQITIHPIPEITLNVTNTYCVYEPAVLITGTVTPPMNGAQGTGQISGQGVVASGLNTVFFDPQTAGPGIHTITYDYISIHGCVNSVTNQIVVNPMPVVNITLGNEYCTYDPEDIITFYAYPFLYPKKFHLYCTVTDKSLSNKLLKYLLLSL